MAINFPDSPVNGDTHVVGNVTYVYDNAKAKWNGAGQTPNDRLTEGSNKLEIDGNNNLIYSGGNFAVGTSTANSTLTLYGDSSSSLRISKSGVLAYDHTFDGSTYTIANNNGSSGIDIVLGTKTAGGESLRIDSNGRLLIGTQSLINNSVASNFQIASDFGPRLCIARNDTDTDDGNLIGSFDFYGNHTATAGGYELVGRILCEASENHTDGSKATDLAFYTCTSGTDSATEKLRIKANGCVGIGVDPDVGFDVRKATAGTIGRFYDSGSNGDSLYNGGPIVGLSRISDGSVSLDGPLFQVGIDKNNSTSYNIDETLFCVANTGVGVGLVAPAHPLDVKTSINQIARFETTTTSDLAIELKNSQGSMFFGLGGGEEFAVGTTIDLNGSGSNLFYINNLGVVGTQLKIEMRENLTDAFSLESNGANGYFRIVDEYDTFERLRIHGDGALSINTTTLTNYDQTDNTRNIDTTSSSVGGNFAFRRDKGTMLIANDANPGWALMYLNKFNWNSGDDNRWAAFYLNGSPKDTITWNGSNVIFGGASDYRIKENIRDFTGGIEKVKQLKVRLYDYIETDRGNDRVGFIAHELQEVVPEAVSGEKDGMRKEEETGEDVMNIQMVEYGKITPVLTAALQEAIAEIETLRARLDAAGL